MRAAAIALMLMLATPALAVDGVLEINQTCAVETGCFAGDAPGFPVTISASGSYRLTSKLIVPNENTDGILFNASDIGIDLNNFAIIGAGCVGSTTDCTPTSGTGSGIERTSALNRGVSVKNGSITGMGNYGVFIGDQARITNISVRWNRVDGINTSSSSTVSGNTAYQNGRHGINVFTGSTIFGNTANENDSFGITAVGGSTIFGNTANQNNGGISAGSGSVISDNAARDNGSQGITCFSGCTVSGNAAISNKGIGIIAFDGSTVQRNSVSLNGEYGLELAGASYRENTIQGNTLGTVRGGVNAGGNVCNGSLTCP